MFPVAYFDFNGVLVDDEAVHLEAFREALSPLHVEVSDDAYWDRYIGFDDVGAFRAMLSDAGLAAPDELVASLVEAKRPLYLRRARASLRTFPGAAERLLAFAARGPVLVVSGALRDEIELGLGVLGVRDRVAAIVSAEDTRRSKPDPEGYELGMARAAELGVRDARDGLVIEDSVAGVQAAKGALLACVAVEHSYPRAALESAGADLVVPTLAEVTDAAVSDLFRRLRA